MTKIAWQVERSIEVDVSCNEDQMRATFGATIADGMARIGDALVAAAESIDGQ